MEVTGAHGTDGERFADRWIVLATLTLVAIGILMVFSTTAVESHVSVGDRAAMLKRHFVHLTVGIGMMFALSRSDPERWYRVSLPLLLMAFFFLLITLVPGIGHVAGGARRWLILGPLRFQPGEFAKLAAVLYFSSYIDRHHGEMSQFTKGVVLPFSLLGVFAALLLLEPDFGSTAVIVLVVIGQLFLVCRVRHMALIGISAATALGTLVLVSPYRMKRFLAFLDPFDDPNGSGYQLVQSLIAVGSGGLSGVGLGAGKQKLFYLPAAHTDFIFAVIAEELGFPGTMLVLGLFFVILLRGLRITRHFAERPYLACVALGCTLLVVLPALLNMGVVLGLLPTKGMVLPLVAYGGTAMIVHLAAVGILLRLSRFGAVP